MLCTQQCNKFRYICPGNRGRGRDLRVNVRASSKAAQLLTAAKQKYESGDKLQASKLYEDVLLESPTAPQRQAALFGNMAVHASFGDVELAQMTLRAAIQEGLDLEQALQDPDLPEIVTSQQILIQLKRFNQQVLKSQLMSASRPQTFTAARARSTRATDLDLEDILGKPNSEKLDIDASPLGIAKRVAVVLLTGVLLGTVLFYIGLESLFPKY
ncbi:hypothetical protein CEUSTIGMA_g490.t1 [Chlamydomonas eustigma]|uniref:Uncharacterized protein n=1 Tax=Chlamydomonas eustigma TaxID=1157962 RepID=A0A250WQD9_9CHLO|nr:hypothetical protein CEUSTIGMA_g490.t1 [Chlamydomonas eustigma]|eukprot:GAX73038.1 hypothetical protein CEUSTIGMA_g490.t1 [Chlamydomonas eustigma]